MGTSWLSKTPSSCNPSDHPSKPYTKKNGIVLRATHTVDKRSRCHSATKYMKKNHQRKHKFEHQPRRFWAPAEAILSTSRGDFEHQLRRFWAPAEAILSTSRGDFEHHELQLGPPEKAQIWAPAEAILSTSRGDFEHQPRRFWAPRIAIGTTRESTNLSTRKRKI